MANKSHCWMVYQKCSNDPSMTYLCHGEGAWTNREGCRKYIRETHEATKDFPPEEDGNTYKLFPVKVVVQGWRGF